MYHGLSQQALLVCSYVVKEADVEGTIDAEATMARGLMPGPQYAVLKRGGSVELPDGSMLHSHEVRWSCRASSQSDCDWLVTPWCHRLCLLRGVAARLLSLAIRATRHLFYPMQWMLTCVPGEQGGVVISMAHTLPFSFSAGVA